MHLQDVEERENLLDDAEENGFGEKKDVTPLPKVQMAVIMLMQLVEPVTSMCIYPFINQVVLELGITGGDERKVGYYAGLIESLFYAAEAFVILHWCMLSDRIGRKPVLLIGLAGLCGPMAMFGLARTFAGLIIFRCLSGFMNGNLGVTKSLIGDIATSSNMTRAYSLTIAAWSTGTIIGPFLGGALYKPSEKWPETFSNPFWADFPYFLPCAAAASFSRAAFLACAIFLREPRKSATEKVMLRKLKDEQYVEIHRPKRYSLVSVLTRPVIISIANYGTLALFDTACGALRPLFYSSAIDNGGLGLTPEAIGLVLATYGVFNGCFQAFFAQKCISRLGYRRCVILGTAAFVPMAILFPVINSLARMWGRTLLVWVLVAVQISFHVFVDFGFSSIFTYISYSARDRNSLGAVNGVGQVLVSILRAIGPASVTSLFALSVEFNLLGGHAVYVVMGGLSFLATCFVARLLPEKMWDRVVDG